MEGFIREVAVNVATLLSIAVLAYVGKSLLAWSRVRANDLLLVKLIKAVKQKYPTLGATNLEKQYIGSVKDMTRPIRYGFLGLRRAEATDLPLKELVKVFQTAVKKHDRLVVLKIAIMSMGEENEYKAHYENLMDELREEDSMWFIRDLTAKHVEMAAVFLMTKAWAVHPISLLEQKSPYHLTLAKLLFPKRVWKRVTSVVREKGEK